MQDMIEFGMRDETLCDCTIEVAEWFACMPGYNAEAGQLLDLLAHRLERLRDRSERARTMPDARLSTSTTLV
ncbi:hypothetical protein ASD02_10905 [Ensifer sp. Root1252]|nr:hypothetical protein ASD02_10905 [Ensifer sp. Root1252]KRC74651.1 hypothetical protein ASE32_06990 [Ensifer sp. Root231]KRC94737.1 hypothetical protein ASE47_07980 [Ensifer sp. Root258]PSS66092.1 hypothetical protein C6558_06950 [Ensifer sp. NM-2]